jgi:hypothetical protein
MEQLIFGLCALTAAACATLLLRGWLRTHFPLLLWSGLCFVGLTLNNVLLVLDKMVFTDVDLGTWRLAIALIATLLLLGALILQRDA